MFSCIDFNNLLNFYKILEYYFKEIIFYVYKTSGRNERISFTFRYQKIYPEITYSNKLFKMHPRWIVERIFMFLRTLYRQKTERSV